MNPFYITKKFSFDIDSNNLLVCGRAGSGKNTVFLHPNILLSEQAMIVSENGNEECSTTKDMLQENGFSVKVLSLDACEQNNQKMIVDEFIKEWLGNKKVVLFIEANLYNQSWICMKENESYQYIFDEIKKKSKGHVPKLTIFLNEFTSMPKISHFDDFLDKTKDVIRVVVVVQSFEQIDAYQQHLINYFPYVLHLEIANSQYTTSKLNTHYIMEMIVRVPLTCRLCKKIL